MRPSILLLIALAQCEESSLQHAACSGNDAISQDVWTLVREIDRGLKITHVPGDFFVQVAGAFFHIVESNAVDEVVNDCALGFACMIIQALPAIEMRLGLAAATDYYILYQKLVHTYGSLRNLHGFSWGLESHQSASYPLLLGFEPQKCSGSTLKVFMYETEFATRVLRCSQGMFASEVFVHRYLLHSECRTEDPEEADFFFVPVYAACVMTKDGKLAGDMDTFYKELLQTGLPYYQSRSQDHLFLWSSETYDFPSWEDYIGQSVFLTVESTPIECSDFDFFSEETASNFGGSCWHCPWCFSHWKDIVIPGFVEKWSVERLRNLEKDPSQRKFTACYHGADSAHLAIYEYANATARNELQLLRGIENVSIGYRLNRITDYFERIGDCHFCFAPKGLGYWSNRLYEVLFAGCIPVILSDEIGLPFENHVNWTSFSLKWPMHDVTPNMIAHLQGLVSENWNLVQDMHEAVVRNRCWFDYNSEDEECSPYRGILMALEKRKAGQLRTLPKTWGGSGS